MDTNDGDEDEFGFSRNYFLAKELSGSGNKFSKKLSDINLVDEQKAMLEDFASTALADFGVLVVNGYLHSINIKLVVIAIAELLWDQIRTKRKGHMSNMSQPFRSQTMEELLDFLDGSEFKDQDLVYVVIHNIDGPGLRDGESQKWLARIASCSQIRMIASIDHVNAPLLWDKKMVAIEFNWCWYHVPTFAPYKAEGVFLPLILANSGTAQTAKTAAIVLQSLTPNAQSVFKVLAEYQQAHPDEEGLPVNQLYTMSRERFLVSSQLTLNSHLTEFRDHELLKTRRHGDGQDCLYIPLSSEAIENLLLEIS
ncbi:hypothetical protein AMTRI_Chr04g248730 [Amborella trichopoda]